MRISIILSCLIVMGFSKLIVYNPKRLKTKFGKEEDGTIEASLANFGHTPYGHSIIGNVFYNVNESSGCEEFTELEVTGEKDPDNIPSPIILVERGGCSFVKKVRNVEHAGGALAVIIDDKEGEMMDHIIMVDDGTGAGINIPSMLISKRDGKILKNQLAICSESEDIDCISLLATFELPHPDNRVEYELWYSSSNDQAIDFLVDFQEDHSEFKKDVLFTPRFVVWGCPECDQELKGLHCFGDGKYCAYHPENPLNNGQEILYEDLREKCLHNKLQKQNKEGLWWDYMYYVHANCRQDINRDCSKRGIESLDINFEEIEECVNDSFFGSDHTIAKNSMLQREKEDWKNNGPHFFPAIIINNVTYRGFLTPDNIFQAICEGFKKHPKECKSIMDANSHTGNGISLRTMVFIVAAILACNLILLLLYRRYYKKEMQSEVKMAAHSAVSQYFAIKNSEREMEAPGI